MHMDELISYLYMDRFDNIFIAGLYYRIYIIGDQLNDNDYINAENLLQIATVKIILNSVVVLSVCKSFFIGLLTDLYQVFL